MVGSHIQFKSLVKFAS